MLYHCYSKNKVSLLDGTNMRQSEIGKQILKYLIMGGGLFFILSSPVGTRRLLKQIPKELKKYKRAQLLRALSKLKERNQVTHVMEQKNIITVNITSDGKTCLKKFDFDNLSIQRPKVWDQKWRMVIFDIPEKKKLAREALREKLKDLGLIKLQDSIWVTPFPCEQEINLIKSVFNLSDYWLDVIVTDNIGLREYQFRKYFSLIK